MIINKIAFGNDEEAFIEKRFTRNINIISSDDNNKGKTLVIQSGLYAIGNEPIFPSSFDYKKYHYIIDFTLDNGANLICYRKNDSFIIKIQENLYFLDGIYELKRFLNKKGIIFPNIIKDDNIKMVDPMLLYQLFFVGQDTKNTANIFNSGYYNKDDFIQMLFGLAGINDTNFSDLNVDNLKEQLKTLKSEEKELKKKTKMLKVKTPAMKMLSLTNNKDDLLVKYKQMDKLKEMILENTKERNTCLNRKMQNELILKQISSLNIAIDHGKLKCADCGSSNIKYSSCDDAYSFDITTPLMRKNIKLSLEDKINSYKEKIEDLNKNINFLQKELQKIMEVKDVSLSSLVMYKDIINDNKDEEKRLIDIQRKIDLYSKDLIVKENKCNNNKDKQIKLLTDIKKEMNIFYHKLEPDGTNILDLFTKRNQIYSGCEATEFYLSRLFALKEVLKHKYPIIMDHFRAGELSSKKEEIALNEFSKLDSQVILTVTLKKEEFNKYKGINHINNIDYTENASNHILSNSFLDEFKNLLLNLNVKL